MINATKACRAISKGIVAVLTLVGMLLLDHRLGPISFPLRRLGAAMALCVVASIVARPRRRFGEFVAVILAVATIAMVLSTRIPSFALVGYVLVLSLLAAQGSGRLECLAGSCTTYLAIRLIYDLVPRLDRLDTGVSKIASKYLHRVVGTDILISPTMLGGPVILLAVLYLLWSWRTEGSRLRLGGVFIILPGWFLLTAMIVPAASAGPLSTFLQGAMHGVAWLVLAVFFDAFLVERSQSDSLRLTPQRRWCIGAVCVASFLAGICLVGTDYLVRPTGRTILVHNRGGLDWDRPVFGKFGAFSSGMFGLLPVYCRANGYEIDVIDKDDIDSADLAKANVLILINSPKIWKGRERQVVLDFVARGGGLLVLGDHTDVFGLMRGFNSLVDEFGIQFQFDSAYHARSTWRGCLLTGPDAISARWEGESPGVAIGSSLSLSGDARPLLRGYGHSDHGMRENIVGSFLGNYQYDSGEYLGELPLVATAVHGKGRVVVLGDTSPFQGGLSYSFPRAVGPILELLRRPVPPTERPMLRILAALALFGSILAIWRLHASAKSTIAFSTSLLAGLATTWFASLPQLETPILVDRDLFLVDSSHLPAVGHYEAGGNSIGPLYTNLLRSGFRVAEHESWDPLAMKRARGVAFVAPTKPFSAVEVQELLNAEENGSIVILAVGEPDSAGALPLLLAHDLKIAGQPLGTIPKEAYGKGKRAQERPRFLDAWPIVSASGEKIVADSETEIVFEDGRSVTALFRRRGRGGLLLFSDTRFFSSANVEDVAGHWLGNLALIHDVFKKYLGANPENVRPLFHSPLKPE